MSHDEVRDFFYARQNYLDTLGRAAGELSTHLGVSPLHIRDTETALLEFGEAAINLTKRGIAIALGCKARH